MWETNISRDTVNDAICRRLFAAGPEAEDVTGHTQLRQKTTIEKSRSLFTHQECINKQIVRASALEVLRL